MDRLYELSSCLQEEAWQLRGQAHESIHLGLKRLLRAMNSYYTNKIEGQHTIPTDIERALQHNYDKDPERAARQRLALAHIETEEWAEHHIGERELPNLYDTDLLIELHKHLYEQLPEADRVTKDGDVVIPGELRHRNVTVGQYVAPTHTSVPEFLHHWSDFYSRLPKGDKTLIGLACAHHRLAWMHPFLDGNGRVARLHSHLALYSLGLTRGLWSSMRGLARAQDQYYVRLRNADQPRQGGLDGRGNLSQKGLTDFAQFFLETCVDQVQFMREMLDLDGMKQRLRALLLFEAQKPTSSIREEALNPLHYVFLSGPVERGEFKRMTGLAPRSADRLIASLVERGLLASATPKGPVHFEVPLSALRFLFPNLWPEAEAAASAR